MHVLLLAAILHATDLSDSEDAQSCAGHSDPVIQLANGQTVPLFDFQPDTSFQSDSPGLPTPQQARAIQDLARQDAQRQIVDDARKMLTKLRPVPHEYASIKAFLRKIAETQADLEVLQQFDALEDEVIRRKVQKIRSSGEKLLTERGEQWLSTETAQQMMAAISRSEEELSNDSKKLMNIVPVKRRGVEARILKLIVRHMISELEDHEAELADEERLEQLKQPMSHLEELVISTLQILAGQWEADSPSRDLAQLYRATIPTQRQLFKDLVFREGRRLQERLNCPIPTEDTAKAVLVDFRAFWKTTAENFSGHEEDPTEEFGDLPQIPMLSGYHDLIQQMVHAMTTIALHINAVEQTQ